METLYQPIYLGMVCSSVCFLDSQMSNIDLDKNAVPWSDKSSAGTPVVFMNYLKWPEVFATSDQTSLTIAELLVKNTVTAYLLTGKLDHTKSNPVKRSLNLNWGEWQSNGFLTWQEVHFSQDVQYNITSLHITGHQ